MVKLFGLTEKECIVKGETGCYARSRSESAVMQYTGLKDKNGNEIYEGDIVKCLDGSGLHIIRFDKENAAFIPFAALNNSPYGIRGEESIIIGNIYENPKLLK